MENVHVVLYRHIKRERDSNKKFFFKWYRKLVSHAARFNKGLDEPVKVWPSIAGESAALVEKILENAWASRALKLTNIDVYTDASDTGWGAVLFTGEGTVFEVFGKWNIVICSFEAALCSCISC